MPAETKDKEKESLSVDDKQRRMSSTLNPLKSHFGVDIGLPWPGMHIVRLIMWTFFMILRLLAYSGVGLLVFIFVYGGSVATFCPFVSTQPLDTCLTGQISQPEFILGNFLFTIGVVAILIYIDYRVDWKQYL